MAKYREFSFTSTDGKSRIHAMKCTPENGEVKAVLQIVHGVSEHIRRYQDFAGFMADNGIAVVGHSHIGHGESGDVPGFFAEQDGWDIVLGDVRRLREMAGEEFGGVPYFMLGHSMGSFAARTYLIKYPGDLDGCIISGTGYQPAALCAVARTLAKAELKKHGPRGRSQKLYNTLFGSNNKRVENPVTDCDWLSRDEAAVQQYIEDEYCGGVCTVSLYMDIIDAMNFTCTKSNAAQMNRATPVYFISGTEDPVGSYGKGVEKCFHMFKSVGCRDVSMKLYDGGRHEMLNETNKYRVYTDILGWIKRRL